MSAKPPQESLDFGRLYKVTDAAREIYKALNDAVDQVGVVVAAGSCGMDRGDLRKNLDRGHGEQVRRVSVEHAMAIAAVVDGPVRLRISNAFVKPLDLQITDVRPLTDKERADTAEAVIRMLGPIAENALATAMGARR